MTDAAQLLDLLRRVRELERVEGGTTGTFTPTYFGQSTAGVTTYTVQVGAYTRIGDRIDFTLYVAWSNATGTGNALVGGLPFASRNTSLLYTALSMWISGITYAAGAGVNCHIAPNSQNIIITNEPASNTAAAQLAVEAAGEFIISGHYFL